MLFRLQSKCFDSSHNVNSGIVKLFPRVPWSYLVIPWSAEFYLQNYSGFIMFFLLVLFQV